MPLIRHRFSAFLLCLVAVLGQVPRPTTAQAEGGRLHCQVLDREGRPVANAAVRVDAMRREGGGSVDAEGWVEISLPDTEATILRISAPGFREETVSLRSPYPDTLEIRMTRIESLVVRAFAEEPVRLASVDIDDLAPGATQNPTETIASLPGGSSSGKGGHDNVPAVRGLARGRTLLILEEMRLTSERRVGVSASFVPSAFLRELDVTRGPTGTLNGSEAIGGVIGLSLLDPEPSPGHRYEWGTSYSTQGPRSESWFTAEGTGSRWAWLASVAQRDAEAYEPGGSKEEVGDSGLLDRGFWVRVLRRGDRSQWKLGWLHTDADFVGRPDHRYPRRRSYLPTEDHDLFTSVFATQLPSGDLLETSVAYHDRSATRINEIYEANGDPSRIETARDDSTDWNLRTSWVRERGSYRWQGGVDFLFRRNIEGYNSVATFPSGGSTDVLEDTPVSGGARDDLGAFAAIHITPTAHVDLDAGFRIDAIDTSVPGSGSRSESDWSGHLGFRWRERTALGVGLLLGRAFRSPGVYELFYDGLSGRGIVHGDPDLDSESAEMLELWLGGRSKSTDALWQASWEARLHRTDLQEFIDRVSSGDEFFFVSRREARLEGVELAAAVTWNDRLELRIAAQRLVGEDRDTGERLNDIPQDRVVLQARYRRDRWELGTGLTVTTGSDEVGPDEVPIGGSALWDAGGAYRFGKGFDLSWKWSNLLDRRTFPNADERGVPVPGRSFTVTIRHRFDRPTH